MVKHFDDRYPIKYPQWLTLLYTVLSKCLTFVDTLSSTSLTCHCQNVGLLGDIYIYVYIYKEVS